MATNPDIPGGAKEVSLTQSLEQILHERVRVLHDDTASDSVKAGRIIADIESKYSKNSDWYLTRALLMEVMEAKFTPNQAKKTTEGELEHSRAQAEHLYATIVRTLKTISVPSANQSGKVITKRISSENILVSPSAENVQKSRHRIKSDKHFAAIGSVESPVHNRFDEPTATADQILRLSRHKRELLRDCWSDYDRASRKNDAAMIEHLRQTIEEIIRSDYGFKSTQSCSTEDFDDE